MSQTGKQIITIHILPDISRSKDNQIMKSGKLIEYDMKNIFLEKSYPKCCGEISPRPFSKESKLSIYLDQQYEFLYILFLLYVQIEGHRNILKLTCRTLAFTFFRKQKEIPASFPHTF